MNKKRTILILSIVFVVLLLGAAYFIFVKMKNDQATHNNTSEKNYTQLTSEVRDTKVETNADFSTIIDRYSDLHQQTYSEVRLSDPSKWDTTMVEKAYFVIEVSRKVSEYPIVDVTLKQLASAQSAGINIDIESVGANQQYRDEIRAETDDALSNPDYLPSSTKRAS